MWGGKARFRGRVTVPLKGKNNPADGVRPPKAVNCILVEPTEGRIGEKKVSRKGRRSQLNCKKVGK